MNLRKLTLVLALAALIALAVPAMAFANYAIHGNYIDDTHACAGCHRAHTSVSTLTWTTGSGAQSSALLISSATQMSDFCYACHDGVSLGADTNVQDGIYLGDTLGVEGDALNGGGFEGMAGGGTITSTHMMEGSPWGAYGGGYYSRDATDHATASDTDGSPDTDDPYTTTIAGDARSIGQSTVIKMDCVTCHDPHGSPNYRILKSYVNGNYVGGYAPTADPTDPNPDGYVSSVETGWPAGGFRLHTAYDGTVAGIAAYLPNYTEARYAKGYDMTELANGGGATAINSAKGMSGWCIGCHVVYMSEASTYNAGDDVRDASGPISGYLVRHRHPINVPLSNYDGPDKASMIVTAQVLPLAHSIEESAGITKTSSDWIECLTCHRAHGTSATMTGWADELAADPFDQVQDFIAQDGVEPSALLRLNNRGVCEVCHNK